MIHFAPNFTESIEDVRDHLGHANKGSFENRDINIYLDTTDQRLTFFLNWKLYKTFGEFGEQLMRDCEFPIKLWTIP